MPVLFLHRPAEVYLRVEEAPGPFTPAIDLEGQLYGPYRCRNHGYDSGTAMQMLGHFATEHRGADKAVLDRLREMSVLESQ